MTRKILFNLGSGGSHGDLPALWASWRRIDVDIDPATAPDIVANLTDLGAIEDAIADAIWLSHALEHLYQHEVVVALAEIRRILRLDGIACIRVPDLQAIAGHIAADRMHETLYQAKAGPVTAHDIVFGYGRAIAQGRVAMAHRTGFTPTVLVESLRQAGFASLFVSRRPYLELVALVRDAPWTDDDEPARLLVSLGL